MTRRALLSIWRPALILLLAWILFATPAQACGCGGYIPRDGDSFVAQERALVRWDGHTEDIVMALDVKGASTEAAWIMPVPSRATVKLGDPKLFDALQELTKPLIKEVPRPISLGAGVAAPPPGASVIVLDRETLGPFDVSNLAANDATALSDWLKANGYNFPPELVRVLQPYVAQNWYYIALRLTPGAKGQELQGALDPLWVTFASDRLVYPMRASALAPAPANALLYVLADHRVTKGQTFGDSHVAFADWVQPSALARDSPLAPFVTRKWFLTKFQEQVNPSRVNGDFEFSYSPTDETYHDIHTVEVDDWSGAIAGLLFLALLFCVLPLFILVALASGLIWLVRRRPKAPMPSA